MPGLDFLNPAPTTPPPKKDDEAKRPAQDVSFHVPEPSASAKASADKPKLEDVLGGLRQLINKVDAPKAPVTDKVFVAPAGTKLTEPVLPKAAPTPPVRVPPPQPPKPPVAPPPPSVKPPEPPKNGNGNGKGGETLRVSLISVSGAVGLSELAVRARLRLLAIVAVSAILLDALVFGGLTYWRVQVEKQVAGEEASVRNLDQEIVQAEKAVRPARDLQALLKSADQVLANHRHWTQVLAMVEELAKPNVTFSSMSLSDAGTLTTSLTAPDFLTVAQQILALRADPRVKAVPFTGASKSSDGSASVPLAVTFDSGVLRLRPEAASGTQQ